MEKTIISYSKYGKMLDKLTTMIKRSILLENLKYVYGPPRGGLPIAVHMSHHLNLIYVGDYQFNYAFKNEDKIKTLVVDDISDTGKTLIEMRAYHDLKFVTATLFLKDRTKFIPDFWVEKNNSWIVFPFEKNDETPNR